MTPHCIAKRSHRTAAGATRLTVRTTAFHSGGHRTVLTSDAWQLRREKGVVTWCVGRSRDVQHRSRDVQHRSREVQHGSCDLQHGLCNLQYGSGNLQIT